MDQSESTAASLARRSRRRWLQFSLRGFLVVLTIGCVWLGWQTERAREQANAVKAIEALGGVVQYDWQTGSRIRKQGDAPTLYHFYSRSGPPWMHSLFQRAERVYFFDPVSETRTEVRESIPHLQHLRWLKQVVIRFWTSEETTNKLKAALPNCEVL